jgi:dimeric dUTPase (all-alpha-NTP-PPase superfamily)
MIIGALQCYNVWKKEENNSKLKIKNEKVKMEAVHFVQSVTPSARKRWKIGRAEGG